MKIENSEEELSFSGAPFPFIWLLPWLVNIPSLRVLPSLSRDPAKITEMQRKMIEIGNACCHVPYPQRGVREENIRYHGARD